MYKEVYFISKLAIVRLRNHSCLYKVKVDHKQTKISNTYSKIHPHLYDWLLLICVVCKIKIILIPRVFVCLKNVNNGKYPKEVTFIYFERFFISNFTIVIIFRIEICEVCDASQAKYTCPKCEVRTCCLDCVNIHKTELECDGIRDRTKFIPRDQFTDLDLLNGTLSSSRNKIFIFVIHYSLIQITSYWKI